MWDEVGGVLVDRRAHRRQYRPEKLCRSPQEHPLALRQVVMTMALPSRLKSGPRATVIFERCRHAAEPSDYCPAQSLLFLVTYLMAN